MVRYLRSISKPGAQTSGRRGGCPHQLYSLVRYTDTEQVVVTKVMDTSKQSASCEVNTQQGNVDIDLVEEVTTDPKDWMNGS